MPTHRNTTNLRQGNPAPECQISCRLGAEGWSTVAELSRPWTVTATIAAGGLPGGITSTMAGGNFWDGFYDGLFVAGFNHAMHLVVEGGKWVFLKSIESFTIMKQSDGFLKNPKMCKYVALAMVEKYFLGDFARSAEDLKNIAEDNGWDKFNLKVLYEKLSAEYNVAESSGNSIDIQKAMKFGCPIIFASEKFNSIGSCTSGHATVITGINRNGVGDFELQLADPLYSNPGGDPYNYIQYQDILYQQKYNNTYYEIIRFEPYYP